MTSVVCNTPRRNSLLLSHMANAYVYVYVYTCVYTWQVLAHSAQHIGCGEVSCSSMHRLHALK